MIVCSFMSPRALHGIFTYAMSMAHRTRNDFYFAGQCLLVSFRTHILKMSLCFLLEMRCLFLMNDVRLHCSSS